MDIDKLLSLKNQFKDICNSNEYGGLYKDYAKSQLENIENYEKKVAIRDRKIKIEKIKKQTKWTKNKITK